MNHYEYEDYNSILEDTDDLYPCEDTSEITAQETCWENYYHSITEELVDD